MANILLITHWTDGDVFPFIEIGKQMLKENHKVTLFTHCFYRDKAIACGLNFVSLDTPATYEMLVDDMKQEIDPFRNWEGFIRFQNKYESIEVRLSEFEKISQHIIPEETIIIAKNRSSTAAFLAAEKYSIPLVNIFMNPVEIPNILIFNSHFGSEVLPKLNQLRKVVGLPPASSWLAFQGMAKSNIALWPSWYAPIDSNWPWRVQHAGFMVSPDKTKSILSDDITSVLNSKEIKILITGGTSKMIHPLFYQCCVSACAELDYRSLVVTRYPDLIPNPLPKKAVWVNEASFRQIMPHFDVVIHHGGIGTITNALEAAIPQLILPYYVDRPFNAACIQALGVGFSVPPKDWNQKELTKYIFDLLAPEINMKCKVYSDKLKSGSTLSKITNIIEDTLKSKQSPAMDSIFTCDSNQNIPTQDHTPLSKQCNANNIKMMLLRRKLQENKKSSG